MNLRWEYIIGCLTACDTAAPPKNGSCSGASWCCQADLMKGVSYYKCFFNEEYNTSDIYEGRPLQLYHGNDNIQLQLLLPHLTSPHLTSPHLTSPVFYDKDNSKKPILLEWRLLGIQAKVYKTTPYAFVSNNNGCVTNDAGYRCMCSKGYKGNPYIFSIDAHVLVHVYYIDECLDNVTYPCTGMWLNTLGNFTCPCPRGKKYDQWPIHSCGCLYLCVFDLRKMKHIPHQTKVFLTAWWHDAILGDEVTTKCLMKRCMTIDEQQKKEFGKEILIIFQIIHKNIVKILVCCLEVEVPMVVYEFIPNVTLPDLIHGNHG
ncbi:LOW QUALITY PROTEIN: hypothetical protein U9M48_035313 [Paspalum notatum var. saurae]|uniref:Serine-threonine/tyrosine-protein kinase catalytic domain-containing protein n=1 Tax=Paspalum notatum var. saurae TaxID=547442 RepID=A0AAQ3UBF9_PASNO